MYICFCVDFNKEVEDLTQDIFNFSLKEEEPFSQGSTSPERNDALGVPPNVATYLNFNY